LKQNNDFVTYPKTIIKAENLNEMAARKRLDGRQRELGVCMASRKGSFLNFLPNETLEMTCRRLEHNNK
jgi:hypothetical protein